MPISISNWNQVVGNTTSPKTLSTTWVEGDIVVVIAQAENNTANISPPTATGLTFNQQVTLGPPGNGSDTGPMMEAWVSDPAAADGTQNISVSETVGGGKNWGFARWVITGNPNYEQVVSNLTEAAFSLTVADGDIVLYGFNDWNNNNASQTITTGSGTPTERADAQASVGYSYYYGDWVDVSAGTFDFGVTSYTGLNVAHCAFVFMANTVVLEHLRPDTDVTRVDWVNESAGTSNLWQSIDEASTNDSDYVTVSV